jgi:pyruvate dehydrogenase E2 component (dihydrolipoamide acetyltransferase)
MTPVDPATGTFDFVLPSLGADMDSGRVVEWRVEIGDHVSRGDIVAVVETEKSDIDVEIWHDGIVEQYLVELGDEITVGTPIARMIGEGPSTRVEAPDDAQPEVEAVRSVSEPNGGGPPVAGAGQVLASPYARRLAAERGVDLREVRGSGPHGAVTAADLTAAHATQPSDRRDGGRPPSGSDATSMRRVIAERMARSNREIPHYHLLRQVDITDLLAWLATENESRPISARVLPAACYVQAVARAAARHPELNGFWTDDHFVAGPAVNVAMAISLRRGGLVAPHIASTDELSVGEIMERLSEMVAAARSGNLRSQWMTGSTITVTNLGDSGADLVHGVISPPQVALVGIGRPVRRPWVVEDEIVVRTIVDITLAADHRATDGVAGSRFLDTLAAQLERREFQPPEEKS